MNSVEVTNYGDDPHLQLLQTVAKIEQELAQLRRCLEEARHTYSTDGKRGGAMDQSLTFDDPEARAVSPAEAAKMLDLSERTMQRLLARGEIRSITILRSRRIRVSVLRDYLDRREVAASQPVRFRKRR